MLHFVQMVGIPGSGKTDKALQIANEYDAVVISSDVIREELLGDISDQSDNARVFGEMYKRTLVTLASGKSVIYDATNISRKRRIELLKRLKANHKELITTAVIMATPIKMCLDRQRARDRVVEDEVIWKMVKSFNIPYWYEGWDDIKIIYPDDTKEYMDELYRNELDELINKTSFMYEYDQKNPHHKLSLGDHMFKCYEQCRTETKDESVREAALLHDIGKFLTQEIGKDGVAHYYQHHYVSAYLSLFNRNKDNSHILRRAIFIQWHMQPFFWEHDETILKYKNMLGDDFFNMLMILHRCDRKAR